MEVREAGLAKLFKVSGRTIRDLVAREIIAKTPAGTYDLAEVVPAYTEHLREKAAARGGAGLTDERARIAKERADQLEMQNQRARGELIPADQVEARWVEIAGRVRAAMMAVPSRFRQAAPHLSAADVVALDREIRDALMGLGSDAPPEA